MLITLLPTAALAETSIVEYVDYDITADTTWHAGDYYICKVGNREPRVTNGATLTIESGAKVYFSRRTTAPLPGTEIEPKNPYSSLTVTNGTLSATGVTFTTVPDAPEQTTWQDAGWNGIQAIGAGTAGATSLSFTNCTFEYSGFSDAGTLYGVQSNGINSEVNISVTGCTFRNPNARTTAIRYNNGYNTIGSGTVSVSNSSITGYGRGVQVAQNGDDAVNTTVSGCTFSNISIRPLEINGGRQAVITGNSFNNFVTGQHDYPVLIYDGYSPTSAEQTVTLTGNTFNYGTDANIYPVVIGAGCKINEDITNPNNTFDAAYPAAFRYIVLSRGVGYLNNHRNAVWGDAGIPYLLASEIIVTGTDETNQSSLTIKPGVIVCLGDGIGSDNLTVRGTLAAEGTAAKPITFTKKAGLTYGNTISASVNLRGGSITLKYCVMDGLYRGIEITSPSTTAGLISLENCTVQNSQHSMLLKGYNVSVKNCVIIGKGVETGGGDYVNSTTIEDCSITASGAGSDNGIDLNTAKGVVLKNCLISGFSGYGVAVNSNGYQTLEAGAPLIENCTITGNGHGIVYSRDYSSAYGAFIKNSIIYGNTGLDLANRVYTNSYNDVYNTTIAAESIAYSLIGNDGSSLTFDQLGYHVHESLDKIRKIAPASYANRIVGDPLFAGNGDYHIQSVGGRWNGSDWINDEVTSPCIDAGDPASAYANEPAPNGGRINLGCYGNTAHASKSGDAITSYTITLPDGKVDGYTAYTVEAHGGSVSPAAHGGSYSFTITVDNSFYKSDAFKVKANSIELTPDSDTGVYTINDITADQVITVEGVAKIDTPNIKTQPTDQTVAVGTEVTFSVAAEGYNLTYSWQVSKDGGSTWENIEGATSAQYTIASPALSQSGWQYRCWVKSSADSGTPYFSRSSNIVTLTVTDSGTQYNISISASPSSGGTVSGGGSVNAGASITVTAAPNGSYRFVRWTEGGTQVSTSASYTFNATSNRTLVAVFEIIPPYNPPTSPVTSPAPVTEVNSGEGVTTVNIERLISEGESLTVEGADGAKLVFDTESLKGISEQASGSVKVNIADVSDEYQQTHPGKLVFSLTVNSGDKIITDFGGSVTVSLPYELNEGEDADNVTVWHLTESGDMIAVPCTYDPVSKLVSFTVSHFSLYMVGVASPWENPFADVSENDWYYDAVRFVHENGLMVGTGDTTFSPRVNTSRGMLVTILYRLEELPKTSVVNPFDDVAAGKWYTNAVVWAAEQGIVNGYGNGQFGPEDAITREQMAVILMNYAKFKGYDVSMSADLSKYTDAGSISSWAKDAISWANANALIQGDGAKLTPTGNAERCQVAAILQRFIENVAK